MDKSICKEGNYIVFLDVSIGEEKVGRMVIELFKHIVPKTAENFRALCTGEYGKGKLGKALHFTGSRFHRIIPQFMIQGGDITNFNGTGGESIYGPCFEDENFKLKHKFEGQLSLANTGHPNTNNSQFFITLAPCPHLDGKNVVFGCVRQGFGVAREVSYVEAENDKPLVTCTITNSGQLSLNEDWGVAENDGSQDVYPPFPEDWKSNPETVQLNQMEDVIRTIKNSGNEYFKLNRMHDAQRKYKKAVRYIKWYNQSQSKTQQKHFRSYYTAALLNMAAVQLKFKAYKRAINLCDDILLMEPNNVKALFRRGRAQVSMNNFEQGLQDYEQALDLLPNDQQILKEIAFVRKQMRHHLNLEKMTYARMFQNGK
ncbi:peptidyl-prolyl cis-trans isomerase D [Diaphorina citri]|uniref:peptidylprolyl isomerase n=1 Tax=Diaphorina citri TaxID=121845 RepID=A0A1S3DJY9_DIACI|nr:peptidyl-prolyl cis-trans isomerase D [Diaphorina citri]